MEEVTHSAKTTLKQPVVIKSVLVDLRSQLEKSRKLTQSCDDGEARWRDGMESGLEAAIELLEEALTKNFHNVMIFNFRISNDLSSNQRFTEEEIKNEIKNDNVTIERGLLTRKSDGKVIGEFLK